MWVAARYGHIEIVKSLMKHPDINQFIDYQDNKGLTPLAVACGHGYYEIVELLLQPKEKRISGADPNILRNDGNSALFIAAANGRIECVELLLKNGAIMDWKGISTGATAFFVACQNGHYQVAKLLLKYKANINEPRHADNTRPIMVAVYKKHYKIVKLLIENDAHITHMNDNKWSVFHCAAINGNIELFKLLHHQLVHIMNNDTKNVVKFINMGDVHNLTALHIVCMNGHESVVSYLAEDVKVDIEKRDDRNMKAIDYATLAGAHSIIALLTRS